MADYKNCLPVPNLIYHFGVNENGLQALLQFEPSTFWLYKVWRA